MRKKRNLPNRITFYIILPVIVAGFLFTFLMVSILSPRVTSYFEERNTANLKLATSIAVEFCDENFNTLLNLRLENDLGMVETMRRDALARIEAAAEEFPAIDIVVLERKRDVVTESEIHIPDPAVFSELPAKTEEVRSVKIGNNRHLVFSRYFPFWRWDIISIIPYDSAFSPVYLMRRYIYFTMLGFLVFIITTFLLFFYLLVKRPLTEMARVAEDITGGRMRRVQTSRNDEIGRVIAIFNKMIDSLEENQKAQQASLEEKEVLLREIHHRVKNNLNIVSSLLNLQYDIVTSTNQAKQALKMSRDRIFSMALVHENLYQSETLSQIDMKAYIEAISNNLHNLYAPDKGIAIKNDIDNITMTIEYASPFGLLLNELITNSLTHAFPSREDGTIEVSLKSRENGSYRLTVSDDGVGLPEGLDLRGTKSLGMQLVSILSEQLNGELTVRKDGGATFILDFHLE